jgi:hypothetical protein
MTTTEIIWADDWNEEEFNTWFKRRWMETARAKRKGYPHCVSPMKWIGSREQQRDILGGGRNLNVLKEWPVV